MRRGFVNGKTPEEKFKSIDQTLWSFSRKLGKKVVGIIPPVPIFGYVHEPDADGTIMQQVIPAGGSLARICISVKEYSSTYTKAVKFSCGIDRPSGGIYHSFESRRPVTVEDISVDVEVGDLLTILVEDSSYVRGISVALLYRITVKDSQIHSAMIDQLEALEAPEK